MAEQIILEKQEIQEIVLLTTRSEAFNKIHNRAISHIRDIAHGFMELGQDLKHIQDLKYYEIGGFDDVYQYAEKALGLKKTSVVNYIAVYEKFGKHADLQSTYRDPALSFTQLVELVPVADNPELIKDIKPSTPVKEIRAKKAISKLSAFDQKLEKMLMHDFKEGFHNNIATYLSWNLVYQPKHKVKTAYSEDTVPNQLIFSVPGFKMTVQRNDGNLTEGLFKFWFDRDTWRCVYFNTLEELIGHLTDPQGRIRKAIVNAQIEFDRKEKEAKEKAEAKKFAVKNGNEEPAPKKMFKNDQGREAYVRDMSHWILIRETDLFDGLKVRFFKFDLNNHYMLQQFNDQSPFLLTWQDSQRCYVGDPHYVAVIVRWLKDQKI